MKLHISNNARRVLSVFMTGFMVLSLIPAEAFAGSGVAEDKVEAVTTGEDSSQPVVTSEDQDASEAPAQTEQQAAQAEQQAAPAASGESASPAAAEQSAVASVEQSTNQARAPGAEAVVLAAKASPTYAELTAQKDITNNLKNPNPAIEFKGPDGNYYPIDEYKAKFGDDVKLTTGQNVHVNFQYKNLTGINPGDDLYFSLPSDIEVSTATQVEGEINETGTGAVGRYWVKDGVVHFQFSEQYLAQNDGNVTNGNFNFYGQISESAIGSDGIHFGGVTVVPLAPGDVVDPATKQAAVTKYNGVDKKTGTVYDPQKNAEQFTVIVDTAGNTKATDVTVTDAITFEPANVIDNNKAWTVDLDEAKNAGLETSFTKQSDGTYAWTIKNMPPNTRYKLTYWVYLDSTNSKQDFSFENVATPSVDGQSFKPDTTVGKETRAYDVAKSDTSLTYDAATNKTTCTYTVKVTAKANNTSAGDVYVIDTVKPGGKYVTDVKQTSSVGTISDKNQSGDTYTFKWNVGTINPGETKTLTYTAEFDSDKLYFGADQGTRTIRNNAAVFEQGDAEKRADSTTTQNVDHKMVEKLQEYDQNTHSIKYTLIFNSKVPTSTNKYFDSKLQQFTDSLSAESVAAGFTYAGTPAPTIEAFTDEGYSHVETLNNTGIDGKTNFVVQVPSNMKGSYSYKLTYYVKVPAGVAPSTVVTNNMTADVVGLGGKPETSISDTASGAVGAGTAADIKKSIVGYPSDGNGNYDRVAYTLDVNTPLYNTATIKDTPSFSGGGLTNVINNADMLNQDITKVCIVDGGGAIKQTLVRGTDYDIVWDSNSFTITMLKDFPDLSDANKLRVFCQSQLVATDQKIKDMLNPSADVGGFGLGFNTLAKNKAELTNFGATASSSVDDNIGGGISKDFRGYDSATRYLFWELTFQPMPVGHSVLEGKHTVTEYISADQDFVKVTDSDGNEIPYTISDDGRKVTFEAVGGPMGIAYYGIYTKLNDQYLIQHGYDPDNLVDYKTDNVLSVNAMGAEIFVKGNGTINETGTLSKDAQYDEITARDNKINFTINVNEKGVDLDKGSDTLTVVDTMSRALVLDPDSVRINGKTVAEFGQGAKLEYVSGSNNFKLVIPDGTPCEITYTGMIVGVTTGETGWLTNTARIEGRPGTASSDKIQQQSYEVGAGAYSAVPFYMKKLDGDGNLVSGAEFSLKKVELNNGKLSETDALDTDNNVITVCNDNLDGTYRWLNLIPKAPDAQGGTGYVYVIRETKAPTGCKLNDTPMYVYFSEPSAEMKAALEAAGITATQVKGGGATNVAGMFAIEDENINEKVSVRVHKSWNDNDNSEGFRPSEITINLVKDNDAQHPIQTVKVKADAAGNWNYTFTDLDKYETVDATRKEVSYTVTENPVKEYTTLVSGNATDGYTVTNTHDVATTTVSGLKFWNDANNIDGLRTTITVGVFADGSDTPVATKQVTVNDATASDPNYWAFKFEGLNKYKDDGKRTPITYTVKEIGVPNGYEATEGSAGNNYTIENTHAQDTIDVTVKKNWSDDNDSDGIRPQSIKVQLKADDKNVGEPVTIAPDAKGNWSYVFENLNKNKLDGNGNSVAIKYTVEEVDAPDGYTVNGPTYQKTDDGFVTATIENSHEVGHKVLVDKVDDQGNPVSGAQLMVEKINETDPDQGGDGGDDGDGGLDINALDDGSTTTIANWTTDGTSHELQLKPGNYVLSEAAAPAGYAASDPIYFTVNADGSVTITGNTGAVTGDKLNVIRMTDARELVSLTATKTWSDDNDADGVRPNVVKIQLKADGANVGSAVEVTPDGQGNWTYKFTDLPKFKNDNGTATKIEYTIAEVDTDANYVAGTPVYTTDDNGNVTATLENSHNRKTTSIAGSKVWNDASNQDGVRPGSVTLGVFDADDMNTVVKQVTLTDAAANADDANKWNYKFTDLPENKSVDGTSTAITYVVRELDADGKAVTGGKLSANSDYTVTYDDATHTVTNAYAPGKVSVKVTKDWQDDANRDGLRSDSVTVKLLANGTDTGKTIVLSESNNWTASFDNLDAKADGADITYTISEVTVDGYTTVTTGSVAAGFTVTNTHETAKVNVSGTKVWDDASNQDGKRPQSVDIALYDADDMNTAIKTVTVTAATAEADNANAWTFEFTGLPKNKQVDGKTTAIKYVVRETSTDANYTVKYDDATNTVTNEHKPELIDISGIKTWDDASNQDGIRPDAIHVKVMNGATVAAENDFTGGATDGTWSYKFTGLPKYANGQEIKYTVEETAVTGYQTTYGDAYGITNRCTPGKKSVTVTKDWKDNNDQDGLRPDNVTVRLYADGQRTNQTVTLNEGNGWKDSFTNLDEKKAGQTIKYTVQEESVDATNYTTEIKATDEGDAHYAYTVTNTHKTAKTSVKVTKDWNDRDNKENKRPDSIQLQLMANGQAQGAPVTVTPDGQGNWNYEFTNLDVNANGQKIDYTVAETQVNGYNAGEVTGDATNGFTVTNNETSRKVSFNKVDEQGNPVSGAELTITKADGTDQGGDGDLEPELEVEALDGDSAKWITDGTSHEMQLEPGKYVLSETDAPAGYDTADPIEFTVNDDGTVTITSGNGTVTGGDLNIVTMTDKLTVRTVNVNKVNAGNQALAGADLQVTGTNAIGQTIAPIAWTTDGTAHALNLAMGTYKLVETKAPAGYDKFADVEFKVAADGSVSVTGGTATVDATSGTVTVVATDELTQHDTFFSKVNLGGQPVVGAQLQISGTDAAGQDIAPITWTSGSTPEKIVLPMGSYTFHEEAAPNGYVAVTDITFTVDAEGNITVTDTTSNAMKVAEDGTAVITDQLALFDMTVAKTDEKNNALVGAELQISGTDAAGQPVEPITWTSAEDPQSLSLAMGDYVLTETGAPAGYDKFADVKFHVDDEGKVTITEGDESLVSVDGNINIVAIDKLTQFGTAISKVDLGGAPVIGAELQITGTDALGREIEPISWTSGATPTQVTLPMGSYTFHEVAAPNGYEAVTDIDFTVDAEGKVTVTDTESNAMEVAEDGTVVVTDQLKPFDVNVNKVDESGNPLSAAKLTVSGTDAAGQKIDPITWTTGNGSMTLSLAMGTYTLHEDAAPNGYLAINDVTFTVDAEGKATVVNSALEKIQVTGGNTIVVTDEAVPTKPVPAVTTGARKTAGRLLAATGDVTNTVIPAAMVAAAMLLCAMAFGLRQKRDEE